MPNTTLNTNALTDLDATQLLVQPVIAQSVALQAFTVFNSSEAQTRLPVVLADPAANWVAEAQPITESDMETAEIVVAPAKVAGLTVVSNELAEDSSPQAQAVVGDGLVRSIAYRIDEVAFGPTLAPTVPAPSGLRGLPGFSTVEAPGQWADLDPFLEALSVAEGQGAAITSFIANPADALALARLRQGAGSNVTLLGSDPTQPTQRVISGVPLLTSRHVEVGTVWAIPKAFVYAVVRRDATVDVSEHAVFARDAVAVRGVMRVGLAYPHPAAVVRISRAAG